MLRKTSVLFLLLFTGCEIAVTDDSFVTPNVPRPNCPDGNCPINQTVYNETPMMNPPLEERMKNYSGGSCVHASMETVLWWQGFDDLSAWWRKTYHGGESGGGLMAKAEKAGLKFACTTKGEESFLQWASDTRRGAVIMYYPNHSITFCHMDANTVYVLDNNRVNDFIKIPREEFLRKWRGYGGFGLSPVYTPPSPLIYVE